MTPASAFFVGYLVFGTGSSLPPGIDIDMPKDVLHPPAQAASYMQQCEIVGLKMDANGVMEFDCRRVGEAVKVF